MAERRPIVLINGQQQELPTGDTLPGGGGGGLTIISGTTVLNFGSEEDTAVNTIANASITAAGVKTVSFIPQATTETSLEDFKLNGVSFNIENIIDSTSFDVRGNAVNGATGNYTIKYLIAI